MTKAELALLGEVEYRNYFEDDYPYVLPENDIFEILDNEGFPGFSMLEIAYIKWMLETNNSDLAVQKFVHPAYYFDHASYGAKNLRGRAHVKDHLKKLRRECPFLKLYSGDYLAGLLHDEINYLTFKNRRERFHGPNAIPTHFVGKKSPHDQEMEEIDRLLECVKQIREIKVTLGLHKDADTTTAAKQSSLDSSIDRVLTETARRITERINGNNGSFGDGA